MKKEFYNYLGNQDIRNILEPIKVLLEDDFIYESLPDDENRKQLPTFIPLKTGKFMKLRSKRVL